MQAPQRLVAPPVTGWWAEVPLVEVAVPAGVVELGGPVPVVEAVGNVTVIMPAGVVELVGLVPVVSGGALVDAPAGVVELVGPVPAVEVVNPDPVAMGGYWDDSEFKTDGAKTPSWGHYIRTEADSASLAVVHLLVASTSGYSAVGSTTASWQGTAMSLAYSEVISCQYGTALTYVVFSLDDPSLPSPGSDATVSASISLSGTVYSIGYSTLFVNAEGIELSAKLVRDWPTGGSTDSSLLTGPAYPSVVDPLSCYQTTQVTDRTTHLYRSVGAGKSASNSPAGAMSVYTATGPKFADGKVTPFYDPLDRSSVAGTYRNDGFGTYIFRITPKP